jgi:hypothetical protein
MDTNQPETTDDADSFWQALLAPAAMRTDSFATS